MDPPRPILGTVLDHPSILIHWLRLNQSPRLVNLSCLDQSGLTVVIFLGVCSKPKICNIRFAKFWFVRHGELLPSPPPEADASRRSGPTVFVNVPPDGERQIWFRGADRRTWDAVSVKHIVNLGVRRQLLETRSNICPFLVPTVGGRMVRGSFDT